MLDTRSETILTGFEPYHADVFGQETVCIPHRLHVSPSSRMRRWRGSWRRWRARTTT